MSKHDIKWPTLDGVGKRNFHTSLPQGRVIKTVPLDTGIPPVQWSVWNKTSEILNWNWDSDNRWRK